MNDLVEWLPKNMPKFSGYALKQTISHGDFRLDNVIFDAHSFKIIAVLDWELAAIGSPLADLAYSTLYNYFPTSTFGTGHVDKGFYGVPSLN